MSGVNCKPEGSPLLNECPQLTGPLSVHVVRLLPGMPLTDSLVQYCNEKNLKSAFIITCVGSLTKATLRFANNAQRRDLIGPFEIVSLVGTVSGGLGHLHISLSDGEGRTIGGHLLGDECVYTTAEVVLGTIPGAAFNRAHCPRSGWDELVFE